MSDFFTNGRWKRRLTQFFSLFFLGEWSFYGIFRCPYAVPYIGCGGCPVVQCPGRSLWMWSWIAIGLSALVFGRAFCGWACPGGMAAELLAALAFIKLRLNATLARAAGYGKYIMLAISLYFFFALNNPRWAIPIRTGEFFNSVALTFEHADNLWIYKTAGFLVLFILGGLLIPHLWCRFLCPTGGLLEIFNRFAPIKVTIGEGCSNCEVCSKDCLMATQPAAENCTNCGLCLAGCPTEAIRYQGLPGRAK